MSIDRNKDSLYVIQMTCVLFSSSKIPVQGLLESSRFLKKYRSLSRFMLFIFTITRLSSEMLFKSLLRFFVVHIKFTIFKLKKKIGHFHRVHTDKESLKDNAKDQKQTEK